jgi:hypothetical protein
MKTSHLVVVLALPLLCSCDVLGIDDRELGYLGDTGIPIQISVPDTVTSGVAFDVSIPVYGSGSCMLVEPVEVGYTSIGATLRPFVKSRRGTCTADLRRFIALGRVTLRRAGQAMINVEGQYGTLVDGRHTVRDTTVSLRTIVR